MGREIVVQKGQTLWQAMKENGIVIGRPCGGNGLCQGCIVDVKGIGIVRSCQFVKEGVYQVELPEQLLKDREFTAVMECERGFEKMSDPDRAVVRKQEVEGEKDALHQQMGEDMFPVAVVDIGTTTVALKLFCEEREYTSSFINPQRQYGADVMSRIQAANRGELLEMQTLLKDKLYSELAKGWKVLCQSDDTEMEPPNWQMIKIVISANTTMQHIYRGLSCEGLGKYPFAPVTLELAHQMEQLEEWKLKKVMAEKGKTACAGNKLEVETIYMPGISTYVGADIVSGIYALDILEEEKPVLLLDLGTNGEMVLGCKRKLLVASAAAGPAFEGSPLAMQIYASGIMRVLHEMILCKSIDEYGTLVDKYFDEGYPVDRQQKRLSEESEEATGEISEEINPIGQKSQVRITQDDIREIQMAKAAIRAGIEMLLNAYGIAASEVEKVYLAGGMGYYLNPEDAVAIGLLPEEFLQEGKIFSVGNTSLQGAIRLIKEGEAGEEKLQEIKELAKEIVLANAARFHELYMKYINF